MILLTHILVALSSLAFTTYVFFAPSLTKLRISYGLVGATLLSGTFLVIQSHAPFIDDLIVNPPYLVEFLPQLRAIIHKYKLFATIAGHMGDGNFHIIPLMKLEDPQERAKLLPAMKEVDELVLHYKGSLSGEHNDGLVRGPWLGQMYGPEVLELFKQAKQIMDPQNIFNPHKKANADWDYSFSHIRDHF